MVARGEGWQEGRVLVFGTDMYTLLYWKLITNKDLLYSTWNLYSLLRGSLDGSGVWGRMDTCICAAESLYCSPETITILLIHCQFSSVTQSCPTLCDPMNCSVPGLPVHHQLPESTQTHVHWVSDAIQPSHPLWSPSPPALNLSQHQGLFKLVSSSHQVAKALEFQLQHQSFQRTPRTGLL